MQRVIKFRCYHKKDERYIPLAGISFETNEVVVYQEENFVDGGGNRIAPMDDVILEQFTGLFDKNEKEIYEGDIITVNGRYPKLVKYIDRYACFCLANVAPFADTWIQIAPGWWQDFKSEIIVIGNECDNPELLNNHEKQERTPLMGKE